MRAAPYELPQIVAPGKYGWQQLIARREEMEAKRIKSVFVGVKI
jgi:hypothetical protein